MAGTAYIWNSVEYRGAVPLAMYQGTSGAQRFQTPLSLSITGEIKRMENDSLSDASGVTLWDSAVGDPATFAYMYFWSNKAVALQLIGASSNVVITTAANVGMVLPSDDVTFAANTTVLSADPTTEDIAKIFLWNSSGAVAAYQFALIL